MTFSRVKKRQHKGKERGRRRADKAAVAAEDSPFAGLRGLHGQK
jgi:hypothetical protein